MPRSSLVLLAAVFACQPPPGADDPEREDAGATEAATGASPEGTTGQASADQSEGESSDAESSDDGATGPGTTGADSDRVPMFVAQGTIGRTVISCDDGHTWVADRAWDEEADPLVCGSDDPVRCFEGTCSYLSNGECVTSAECDCGHHPGFAKGVAFGNGYFVATWGWGYSGSVRRSADGVHWEETLTEEVTFGGLAFGGDRFVLSSRSPRYSTEGTDWVAGEEADFRGDNGEIVWSVRRFAYSDYDTGRFIATASPPKSVLVSADGGHSWHPPADVPAACLVDMSTYGGIASGDGVVVGVGSSGTACRSTDGGDTWTETTVGGDNVLSHLVWTGAEFVAWAPGTRYTSPDGQDWTATPTSPEGIRIGPVAHSEQTGSFVAVSNVWEGYESQTFLRSDDGVSWEVLPAGSFTGGHNIFSIAFGYGEPSELCPG